MAAHEAPLLGAQACIGKPPLTAPQLQAELPATTDAARRQLFDVTANASGGCAQGVGFDSAWFAKRLLWVCSTSWLHCFGATCLNANSQHRSAPHLRLNYPLLLQPASWRAHGPPRQNRCCPLRSSSRSHPCLPPAASQLADAYAAEREALLRARREGVAYLVGRSALRAAPGSRWLKVRSNGRAIIVGSSRNVLPVGYGQSNNTPQLSSLSQRFLIFVEVLSGTLAAFFAPVPALNLPITNSCTMPRCPRSAFSWRCCMARWPPMHAPPPPPTTSTARACCRQAFPFAVVPFQSGQPSSRAAEFKGNKLCHAAVGTRLQ